MKQVTVKLTIYVDETEETTGAIEQLTLQHRLRILLADAMHCFQRGHGDAREYVRKKSAAMHNLYGIEGSKEFEWKVQEVKDRDAAAFRLQHPAGMEIKVKDVPVDELANINYY